MKIRRGLSFKVGKYDVSACPSADTRINNSAGADIPPIIIGPASKPVEEKIKYQASKLNIQDSTHSSAVKHHKSNSLVLLNTFIRELLLLSAFLLFVEIACLSSVFDPNNVII